MRPLTGTALTLACCVAALVAPASPAGASPDSGARAGTRTAAVPAGAHGGLPEETGSLRFDARQDARAAEDPDAHGRFWYRVKDGVFCYELTVRNVATPTSARLHTGSGRTTGPVVVTLRTPTRGTAEGCITARPAQTPANADRVLTEQELADFVDDSSGFSIVIRNKPYPEGAIRWRL
ncbi:CHRD domain-containing protein [Streptomyces sp. bgisy100]|uniref:CHRD domain-containing protein n=1 Tax=Streptomyces sp. bgisy100 TaxID=3413783 RepID=UPI003D7468DF